MRAEELLEERAALRYREEEERMVADLDEELRVDLVVGEMGVRAASAAAELGCANPSEPRTVLFDGKTQLKR